jgi:TonB family protein
MFADYALAKRNKQTFYLAKKIGYDELLPALQSQPGEEISKNLHLKLYEKYFYETFGNNGELAMTGWFMITNFNKTTHEISGHQWNYIGQCAGAFSGSLYDDSITINIGEPWNEVWRAKLEGDLLKGTLKMNPTEVGFVHQIQSWVMANINHPILTAEKIAKLKIPYNIARYSEMEENLNSLLTQNMKYPEQAKKDKIEGRVYVSFTVKADGSIANLKVARKVNPLLDEEALRLVNLTDKKWAPAIIDGKPVDSEYMMPIIFRLDKEQANSAQTPVILKGTVIDKGTKKPLANVFIVEFDKNGRFLSGTTTDSNGDYVIKLIDATNSIQVSLNNYKKSTYSIDGITTINIELESEN